MRASITELEQAYDAGSPEMTFYLDAVTSRVVLVGEGLHYELRRVEEALADAEGDAQTLLEEAIDSLRLSDWLDEAVREAYPILYHDEGDRYIEVPYAASHEGYELMEHFVETVRDEDIVDRLWIAIDGRGAFRRFRHVIARYPDEQERWYRFRAAWVHQQVEEWLREVGIELIPPNQI